MTKMNRNSNRNLNGDLQEGVLKNRRIGVGALRRILYRVTRLMIVIDSLVSDGQTSHRSLIGSVYFIIVSISAHDVLVTAHPLLQKNMKEYVNGSSV